MGRRLRFAVIVLISQLLLIALAIAWVIHMVLIAANGAIYFVEENPMILWGEIVVTVIIILFATAVFAIQVYRMGERRALYAANRSFTLLITNFARTGLLRRISSFI